MNLPPSSLLGRLEAFLPAMEKANQTTDKLVREGKLEVLDDSLEVAGADQQGEEAEGTDDEEDEEEEEEEGGQAGAAPPRTVQLDFALGDFDDNPIAKMEQEKEEADDAAEGVTAGDDRDEEMELSGIEGLLGVPGADGAAAAAPAPQAKPAKPLIEEL